MATLPTVQSIVDEKNNDYKNRMYNRVVDKLKYAMYRNQKFMIVRCKKLHDRCDALNRKAWQEIVSRINATSGYIASIENDTLYVVMHKDASKNDFYTTKWRNPFKLLASIWSWSVVLSTLLLLYAMYQFNFKYPIQLLELHIELLYFLISFLIFLIFADVSS